MDRQRNSDTPPTSEDPTTVSVSEEEIVITRNVVENKTPNGPRYATKNSVNQQNYQNN
ncbi:MULTISPECIES: hypothetical protein [unclassified Bradyrhizobium]|uniref:hypothetical protein n=1 Tax=unclassified Bradyrhizobium TaxID=2631580 RepID=UPI0028E60122|nr:MULTISPECIES: hypothetical protein [unclassified Bradyrhizobium]